MPEAHDGDWTGRVALVTGASRGIGAGIGRALAANGASVVLSARDQVALDAVAEQIRSHGGKVATAIADLTDEAAVLSLRDSVEAAFGPAELIAACAGGGSAGGLLANLNVAQWRATLEQNLTSAFLTLKTFLPPMYERGCGSVVLMSSSAGRQLTQASAAYAAAKAGLQSLVRQAAGEAAPHRVRVNAIAPSAIVTERLAAQPAVVREGIAHTFPLGRLGEVDDVVAATLFLLSGSASWITGVVLDVAGGKVMP